MAGVMRDNEGLMGEIGGVGVMAMWCNAEGRQLPVSRRHLSD